MSLALGVNAGNNEPDTISRVAELMDYYASYGDLLVNCVSWNSSTLNQVLGYMTIKGMGNSSLAVERILPQYDNILNRIGVSDKEFLTQLSLWSEEASKVITKENIKAIIPSANFYKQSATTINDLTNHINKVAVEALSAISAEDLDNQKNNYASDYWHVAIQALLSTKAMSSLPENVSEFGKRIIADIASGGQTLPLNEYMAAIVNKLDRRKTASSIAKIRNGFCVDTATINAPKFEFLEPWLRTQGDMESYAGDAVDKILKPIIGNASCRELILRNEEFYISLIEKTADRSYEFKQNLKRIVTDLPTDDLIVEFAEKIAVVPDLEDDE